MKENAWIMISSSDLVNLGLHLVDGPVKQSHPCLAARAKASQIHPSQDQVKPRSTPGKSQVQCKFQAKSNQVTTVPDARAPQ